MDRTFASETKIVSPSSTEPRRSTGKGGTILGQKPILKSGFAGVGNWRCGSSGGFTVIELMVVIVLLFVLIALVALTASGVQAKNRNSDRQTDIDALRSQLESYYAGTDTYPTRANLNDSTWRAKNLPKLKDSAIDDPNWQATNPSCTIASRAALAAKPTADCYSYQVTAADGSACNDVNTPCVHYTLTASLEGGDKYVKNSLN